MIEASKCVDQLAYGGAAAVLRAQSASSSTRPLPITMNLRLVLPWSFRHHALRADEESLNPSDLRPQPSPLERYRRPEFEVVVGARARIWVCLGRRAANFENSNIIAVFTNLVARENPPFLSHDPGLSLPPPEHEYLANHGTYGLKSNRFGLPSSARRAWHQEFRDSTASAFVVVGRGPAGENADCARGTARGVAVCLSSGSGGVRGGHGG